MPAHVRPTVPRPLLLLLAVLAATAGLLTLAPPAAAEPDEHPFLATPTPMPGALVEAGKTELGALLWPGATGNLAPESVTVSIDGEPVAGHHLDASLTGQAWRVRATVELTPGTHVAEVRFTDATGRSTERAWSFTSTARTTRRFAGPGRVETAVALSAGTFSSQGNADAPVAAVLARADDFADALTGVPLAVHVGGPLLLSGRDGLPAATAAELLRVLAPGSTVHLLGGAAALSDGVLRDVAALGMRPVRHGGLDRFETAAAVARLLPPSEGAILASGTSFADALSASVPAARDGMPVLLTATARLPEATARVISERNPSIVTIVGGTAVVGEHVGQQARAEGREVRRVAGPDRYATAVAVLEAFWDGAAAVSLANGEAFPDALAGARHATTLDQPVLLTRPRSLAAATAEALRLHAPDHFDVYGGPAAVSDAVARAAVRAAEATDGAPRVSRTDPSDLATVATLKAVTVEFDRPVEAHTASVYVEFAGAELQGAVEHTGPASLVFRPSAHQPAPARHVAHPVVVAVRAHGIDGQVVHHEWSFTYLDPGPVFATAGPVSLHLPSREVELIAYHEARHRGAQQLQPHDTTAPAMTLPSRQRGTGSRSAADIVAAPGSEVLAPVSGTVLRAGSYVLYCDYQDQFVVIAPDSRPQWEVKMLHFQGLRLAAGDRVVAGQTVVADGPRVLPFRSQVDRYTHARNWPHLHVEVVDPAVPAGPGGGC